jgi:AIPR protein
MELNELAAHLDEEVKARCAGDEEIEGPEDGFTEVMLEYLAGANQIDSWELGYARKPGRRNAPPYKINAWYIHSQGEESGASAPMVDLFVSLYFPGIGGEAVPKAQVAEQFQLARNFLEGALTAFGGRLDQMEESAPPYESVHKILAHRQGLETARIFLLTNGVVKQSDESDREIGGIRVKHYLWDLEKLRRLVDDGVERETIEIDLVRDYGGGIPCLAQNDGTGEYTAYLAFFPATLLARIYGDYGPRLLEKNVRSYLQARGKVNKGIQTTIRDAPQRFLAYNNGISATAESVLVSGNGTGRLEQLRDFQIVNGGQTTASIYHAVRKEKADISNVTVQVKVTVVHQAGQVAEFVPLISQYANSQNKVNTADFSANDVFHQKLESLSRTIWAPAADGMSRPTRWYYERARGSHLDDKAREGTPVRQKAWLAEHPMIQKFTKTDVAKYEHVWAQLPHEAGKGAEKNFVDWTLRRNKAGLTEPDGQFFKDLAAKAILWRRTEKIVAALKLGGYRANVVAYSLSWLSRETSGRLDLAAIWNQQGLAGELDQALALIARKAFRYLTETAGGRNVTEWAKKEECWTGFRDSKIALPDLSDCLMKRGHASRDLKDVGPRPAAAVRRGSWGELFQEIEKLRMTVWMDLAEWGASTGNIEEWQRTMCQNFCRKLERGKKPNVPECKAMLTMLDASCAKGFNP